MILKFDIFIRQEFDDVGYSVSTYRECLKSNSEIVVDNTSGFLSLVRNGSYVDFSLNSLMCQCRSQIVGRALACRLDKEFALSFYFRNGNDWNSITPRLIDKNDVKCIVVEQTHHVEHALTITNEHTLSMIIPLTSDCVIKCDDVEYNIKRGELVLISADENEYTIISELNDLKQINIQ